jgi:hypothetical protein
LAWRVEIDDRAWTHAPPAVRDALRRHAKTLAKRPHEAGDILRRRPTRFKDAPNLYRCPALPDGWRALYVIDTLRPDQRVVRIVFLGTHKEYERLLGYRG